MANVDLQDNRFFAALSDRKIVLPGALFRDLSVDDQPLVEIHNCVLLYNQKLQAYYVGYPGYKRGNRYDNIASVVSPEMNAEIIAAAVHILGQNQ